LILGWTVEHGQDNAGIWSSELEQHTSPIRAQAWRLTPP
jgi:hypothetical protein